MVEAAQHQIRLGRRRVHCRVVCSRAARKLRLRVGPNGVEVVRPVEKNGEHVSLFLERNETWILDQLERVACLRGVRRLVLRRVGASLFRGEPTQVRVETTESRARGNFVNYIDGAIVVRRGGRSQTPAAWSLESWLRQQANRDLKDHLAVVTASLGHAPARVYVMGQHTKWGNCSARRNLAFNWRLILAPDSVLRYVVTHEAVHLAIPDHSANFWLTVRSLYRETERGKQWLCSHQMQLTVDLGSI